MSKMQRFLNENPDAGSSSLHGMPMSVLQPRDEDDRFIEQLAEKKDAEGRLNMEAANSLLASDTGRYFRESMKRRHKALLIGITYKSNPKLDTLKGPINDVREVYGMLRDSLQFDTKNIRVLADEQLGLDDHEVVSPTKRNITTHISWLLTDMKEGDLCFFFFAGHGELIEDKNGDEASGMDQVLCPVDYSEEMFLLDDDLFCQLVRNVPPHARLIAIVDACRCGSVLDLPFQFEYIGDDNDVISKARPTHYGETPLYFHDDAELCGETVLFSACSDFQLAKDRRIDDDEDITMGAFTYAITRGFKYVLNEAGITYGQLLDNVKRSVSDRSKGSLSGKDIQVPQLTSSHFFDIYLTRVVL